MPRFVKIRQPVSEKKSFECFYHIWTRRPSWSCDMDYLRTYRFPLPIDAQYEIWLFLRKQFQRRRPLNIIVIYMYIPHGGDRPTHGGQLFQNHISLVHLPISFQGHDLYNLCRTLFRDSSCQVSKSKALWV